MLFTSVYLANLLCAFYNCQFLRPPPVEISDELVSARAGRSAEIPIVNTTQGIVQGYYMTVMGGKDIVAFEGIPFAEAPVGRLRFHDPVPKRPWKGVRSAMKVSAECLQFNLARFLRTLGQEDCLQLNIYTPQVAQNNSEPKYPVMVFIHGGSWIIGRAADYGPSYLLGHEDFVLVTINYRVGVLGFLSSGDDESLGNWGLKDQALAIKWVHDNIANFGGDPTKITIAGQSAGAASVHLHMLSTTSVATGLFRNAISLSGTASHHWALQTPQEARRLTHSFAKRLNCPTTAGSKVLLDCLRRIEPNFLVGSQNNLIEYMGFPAVLFAPVIEQNATGAFLTESPESAYENGNVAKIPYLCTNTAEEGEHVLMVMKNVLLMGHVFRNWALRGPLLLDIQNSVADPPKAAMEIRDVYLRDVPEQWRTSIIDSNVKLYAMMGSDRYFTLGNRRGLKLHANYAPTYSYIFRYKSHVGIARFLATDHEGWGSPHGEDLTLMFNNTAFSPPLRTNDRAYEVSRGLMSLITNFMIHNVPYYTAPNGTQLDVWKTVGDPDYPMFLDISENEMKMVPDPKHGTEELKVWSRLGIK